MSTIDAADLDHLDDLQLRDRLADALLRLCDEVSAQREAVESLTERVEAIEEHAAGVEAIVAQVGPALETLQHSPIGRMLGAFGDGGG